MSPNSSKGAGNKAIALKSKKDDWKNVVQKEQTEKNVDWKRADKNEQTKTEGRQKWPTMSYIKNFAFIS